MSAAFEQWRRLHADLFGLHAPDDLRLFVLWERLLDRFSFEELREASYAIASDTSDRARFRVNHVSMLQAHILARRSEAAARERDRLDALSGRSNCENCCGVGLVRVPNPAFVVDGELTRGFFVAVACTCPIGSGKFNALNSKLSELEGGERLIDLAQYEASVPDWREIVAAHEEARNRAFEVAEFAARIDRASPITPADIAAATGG